MELNQLIQAYLDGPRQLRLALTGMSAAQLTAHPIPGKWSAHEVVCHIADFEPISADRMKRIIAEESPQLIGADETRFAAALCYERRNLDEELAIIEATRSQMGRILSTLPPDAFERKGTHNERGPVTLRKILEYITEHIPHHVRFLIEKRRALGIADS